MHQPCILIEFMAHLSININKIALIRNSRGANQPNLIQFALDCERFGAQGITVHPRPDGRHIKYQDCYDLKKTIHTELNIEGYPTRDFIDMILKVRPAQVTLVPDPPEALTSDQGWDTIAHAAMLRDIIIELKRSGARVSLFIDPIEQLIEGAADVGADRIEYYTGPYAHIFPQAPEHAIQQYASTAHFAHQVGLGINAGHDLNLSNLRYFKERIPQLLEVSIGHAVVCDALYFGIENTIQMYRRCLN
jgi:pyridoxine 5-phosphate synthase